MLSPATVSKALAGMEDDLLITRRPGSIRLLQPGKLMSLLEKNYTPEKLTEQVSGRVSLHLPHLRAALAFQAASGRIAVAVTGESSSQRYTALAIETEAEYAKSLMLRDRYGATPEAAQTGTTVAALFASRDASGSLRLREHPGSAIGAMDDFLAVLTQLFLPGE